MEEATMWMSTLNKGAAEAARESGIKACTDITGFGLLGHAFEMIKESGVGMEFWVERLPVLEGVIELAEQGLIPGGAHVNKQYLRNHVSQPEGLDEIWMDIICDPQTSGGLLMAVKRDEAEDLLKRLHAGGLTRAAIVGEVISNTKGSIVLQSSSRK